jgi:hypothetical protein
MLRPLPVSLQLANNWPMKFFKVNPRCWKTAASRYWANTTSSGVRAAAEPTAIPSSPAETYVPTSVSCISKLFQPPGSYHIEAQSSLALCLEHDHIHNAHYRRSASLKIRILKRAYQSTYSYTMSKPPHLIHQGDLGIYRPTRRLSRSLDMWGLRADRRL